MKKLLSLLLSVVFIISLSGCGSEKNENDISKDNNVSIQQNDSKVSSTVSTTDEKISYNRVTRASGSDIYINGKDGKRLDEGANARIFHEDKDSLTSLAFARPSENFNGTLDDVISFLNDKFLQEIDSSCFNSVNGSSIVVENSEKTTINGFDSLKFDGHIPSGEHKLHIYGYAFVIEGTPCMVVGVVSTSDQEPVLIAEVDNEVDTMVKTIRTTY